MEEITNLNDNNGHKAYLRIILAGLLLHVTQAIIFYLIKCPIVSIYNIASVIYYVGMLFLIHNKHYKTAVTLIHFEVMTFVITSTILCGKDFGFHYYLIAIGSLVYFCPFDHKFVTYLIACMHGVVFIFVYLITHKITPIYTHVMPPITYYLFLFNSMSSFALILIASLWSNITASVTNERLAQENKRLYNLANYDLLTGLYSRRAFLEQVKRQEVGSEIIIAMGDLDNFKYINDTFGHLAGDYVLKTVGKLIVKHCSHNTIVCRYGGEEFVFLFKNSNLYIAESEIEDLRRGIEAYEFEFEDNRFSVTMTMGICSAPYNNNGGEIIAHADENLYKGKEHGKNVIVSD